MQNKRGSQRHAAAQLLLVHKVERQKEEKHAKHLNQSRSPCLFLCFDKWWSYRCDMRSELVSSIEVLLLFIHCIYHHLSESITKGGADSRHDHKIDRGELYTKTLDSGAPGLAFWTFVASTGQYLFSESMTFKYVGRLNTKQVKSGLLKIEH